MRTSLLRERAELRQGERDAMYRLLSRHFEGVSRPQFDRDLANKSWVILLGDRAGTLQGFTTLDLYEAHDGTSPCSVVYSGDTIVDPCAWGRSAILSTWLDAVLRLGAGRPRPLYWFLLTSGYRTYRLLPVFWEWYFPRFDRPTPDGVRAFMNGLARDRFGPRLHGQTGIVRFQHPQRLRPHLAGIPDGRMSDPHVCFFARRNPGADRGDELVCLTRIEEANLTSRGRRILRSLSPRPKEADGGSRGGGSGP